MDPKSCLHIYRDASGDIIVRVLEFDSDGRMKAVAEVEFCTIGQGGGQSPLTFEALLIVIDAMKADDREGRLAKLPTIIKETKPIFGGYNSGWPSEPE